MSNELGLHEKMYKHFDYLLIKEIRDIVEQFAFFRRCELKEIIMQCDSDMAKTGTNWKMCIAKEGKAYEIADAIAWCNRCSATIKQCKELDLAKKLRIDMQRDLLE